MIPLVELPDRCNPFQKDGVRIYAKLMNMLPLANVKSLPALNMLLEAEESGRLKKVHTLIENSSGNTVFSLATIARLFDIEKTKAIVSHEVTW
jgi:cysteine synthase